MQYTIRHETRFRYSQPIRESYMEVRKRPRSDNGQRCLEFSLSVSPEARVYDYGDVLGNTVHHFDVAAMHDDLRIMATSLVDVAAPRTIPQRLSADEWNGVDQLAEDSRNWDWLHPSHFAKPSELLSAAAESWKVGRRDDPLSVLRELNSSIHKSLAYAPTSTRVDSPIDDCLKAKRGVCQDFAHVFIAMARQLRIPCRYVSGHLFHRAGDSTPVVPDASHAWAEALLPELGWVGFDPANDSLAGEPHIRIAIGRDYADVPPSRGVFKGFADSELSVHVDVKRV